MARRPSFEDTESLSLATRYLREEKGLSQQQVVNEIKRQSGVKIGPSALGQFEIGIPTLGRAKIDALVAFYDCKTPQEMIEKGNAAALNHQLFDRKALGRASRYLRQAAGLTLQQVVDGIEWQSGVKIFRPALQQFERGMPDLGQKKIDALIAFHNCKTPREMIEKGDAAALYHQFFDREPLGLASWYLREAAGLSQQRMVGEIERQSGVKIAQSALGQFEKGTLSPGREKINALIAFHGCATPQEMIEKANRAAAYLFRDEKGKLKNTSPGQVVAHTLRSILDRPFRRLEKLAAERNAQENPNERGR
jgi:transcriptional regulator with XRE-family HTH domain